MSVRILDGNVFAVLPTLPPASVQTCVTSPPYWGLRDYGVEGQLGLERTPEEYVEKMVAVFREVRRVLRDDGTLWLNLGDCYVDCGRGADVGSTLRGTRDNQRESRRAVTRSFYKGLKPKNLIGLPWRVAFALQADGWYLRSDIIWHKPNPMPESVTDRPTKAHEYLFLLTKSERYFYDVDAIREEPASRDRRAGRNSHALVDHAPRKRKGVRSSDPERFGLTRGSTNESCSNPAGKNRRSVWTVAMQPFPGAHFATFPPKLIEPCILAGSRRGDTVLDPFGGAGTTGLVADRLGRDAVLVELNPAYATLARDRISSDAPLFADGAD